MAFTPAKAAELLALHQALEKLAEVDSRKAQVVELRYFGGLEVEEVAAVLDGHPNTVVRDWQRAKAWLKRAPSGPICIGCPSAIASCSVTPNGGGTRCRTSTTW